MAGKDPDAPDAAALLDEAQQRLAEHIADEVDAYDRDDSDAAHITGERRAKRLIALGRAIAVCRVAGPKALPPAPPPPPANENEDMTKADEPDDGLDDLPVEELRARVVDRLEHLARRFEAKMLVRDPAEGDADRVPAGLAGEGRRRPAA